MKSQRKQRGVYEKIPGSGIWWIRFVDSEGALRREKVGSKSAAIALRNKRKAEAWEGKKLPKKLRTRTIRFSELADDYLEHVTSNNLGASVDKYRIAKLRGAFRDRPADIPIADLRKWFAEQGWAPGTANRCRTVLSLIYKLGIENGKIETNPTKLLKRQREPDGRVRFLNQLDGKEEARLRKVIAENFLKHLPEFEIALNTGMRRSEQYRRITWPCVDFLRRDLCVPRSKNGASRHIPLTPEALAAFQELYRRTRGEGPIFQAERGRAQLQGARHWFEHALKTANVADFSWHCLRHTFASRLVMAGVDLRTVAELLGHKRIQMTMRYAHLAPAHKIQAIDMLSKINRKERRGTHKTGRPVILESPAAVRKMTDTRTSTKQNESVTARNVNVQ